MRAYTYEEIKAALEYGDSEKKVLFPEVYQFLNIASVSEIEFRSASLQKTIKELETHVHQMQAEPSDTLTFREFMAFRENGDRKAYEAHYFRWRKDLFSLVLLELLYGRNTYIRAIEERLWFWCDQYTWELPAHIDFSNEAPGKKEHEKQDLGLFAAETGFYFAEILHIMGDRLHPYLVTRIHTQIESRILNPFMMQTYPFETNISNWSSVCAGSVGSAALYTMSDNAVLAKLLERVLKALNYYLSGFDEDGITGEGVYYWCYGFGFYVYFARLLKERTGGKIDLLDDEAVKKVASYPAVMALSDKKIISYSDVGSDEARLSHGLYSILEEIYFSGRTFYDRGKEEPFFWDATHRFAVMIRDIVWNKEKDPVLHLSKKQGFIYEKSQWAIYKDVAENVFFCAAIKGGHNDEPHNHNDIGNVILHAAGRTYLVDLGAPLYTKSYFDPATRYETYQARSLGHNVPLIDATEQKAGKEFYAHIHEKSDSEDLFYVQYAMERAYPLKTLESYRRSFRVSKQTDQLDIFDGFHFKTAGHSVSERFHSSILPVIIEPGIVVIEADEGTLHMHYPKQLPINIENRTITTHSGNESTVYVIIIDVVTETHVIDVTFSFFYEKSR